LPLLALITASCWNRSFNRFESCQYRSGSMFCAKSPGLRHFPVGAGLPAMAVCQPKVFQPGRRFRGQARSHSLGCVGAGDLCWSGPMSVWGNALCEVSRLAPFSCGSGLARDGGVSAEGVLAGPTLSRASPLPQFGLCWGRGICAGAGQCRFGAMCCARSPGLRHFPVGAGLPAKAVCQPKVFWRGRRFCGQARSHCLGCVGAGDLCGGKKTPRTSRGVIVVRHCG